MPRRYKQCLGARRYQNYSVETLNDCLEVLRSGTLTQQQAEERFKISRRTIINKLKEAHPNKPGKLQMFSDEEEGLFVSSIVRFIEYGFLLDSFALRMIIKAYVSKCTRAVKKLKYNIPGCKLVLAFLKHHHLKH